LDQKSLNDITIGIDRGVAVPFQASNECFGPVFS
jgi:hypothetical protein